LANSSPTVGELFKAKAVTDEQLNAAVEAYLNDLEASTFPIADGYVGDLDSAVVEHLTASLVLASETVSMTRRRDVVRTAILLARAQLATSIGRDTKAA
jgi:hypothetical protein